MENIAKWLSQVEPAWAFAIVILLGLGYGLWKFVEKLMADYGQLVKSYNDLENSVLQMQGEIEQLNETSDQILELLYEFKRE